MIRVALIDDHESVRLGLEAACARSGTKEVVFSGSTVRCYLDWRAESGAAPADVVVLDLTLGGLDPLPRLGEERLLSLIHI